MSLQKRKPIRSKAIRNAAKGEPCTVCGRNDGTTVFCHLNESFAGKCMGQKADDIAGFFGCHDCHAAYDGRRGDRFLYDDILPEAMYRTWRRLWEMGVITIK